MTKYQEVVSILRSKFSWPENCAPAPEATARELEAKTPEQVAEYLDNWVNDITYTTEPPHGVPDFEKWIIHRTFSIGREFWEYGTALAFGQIVEPPVDKISPAQSVSEWLRNQSLRRNRLGYVLLDPTPEGEAEFARRRAKASDVPLEWAAAGKALIWELAVMEGMIPAPLDNLSAAYAVKTPSLDSVRALDAQQWLDNLRADDKRKPRPWNDDGSRNLES